jgi:aspartokinase
MKDVISKNISSNAILLAYITSKKDLEKLSEKLTVRIKDRIDKDLTQTEAMAILTIFDVGLKNVIEVQQSFIESGLREIELQHNK